MQKFYASVYKYSFCGLKLRQNEAFYVFDEVLLYNHGRKIVLALSFGQIRMQNQHIFISLYTLASGPPSAAFARPSGSR